MVVFYPHPTRGLSRVARATGGAVLSVTDVPAGALTGIGVFHELSEAYRLALRRLSRRRRLPVRVEDKEFVSGGPQVRGSFLLDDSVGGNTTLAVMYSQKTDIGYVRLKRPGGELEPVYTYTDTTNHLQYARVEHEVSGQGLQPGRLAGRWTRLLLCRLHVRRPLTVRSAHAIFRSSC